MTASRICSGRRSARPADVGVADSGKTGVELTVVVLGTLIELMGCCQRGPERRGVRSQNPGARSADVEHWRGAALSRASIPGDISPYYVERLRNVKTGGSRELPSVML
jgi:hypothetical protein